MRLVPLAAIPNQSFTATLDQVRWVVRLVEASGVMAADVTRDGVLLLTGQRIVAGEPIVPYRYLQTGNFIFLTDGDDLPQWSLFGFSQYLFYLSADEIAGLPQLTVGELTEPPVTYLTTDDGFYLTTDTGELLESA